METAELVTVEIVDNELDGDCPDRDRVCVD